VPVLKKVMKRFLWETEMTKNHPEAMHRRSREFHHLGLTLNFTERDLERDEMAQLEIMHKVGDKESKSMPAEKTPARRLKKMLFHKEREIRRLQHRNSLLQSRNRLLRHRNRLPAKAVDSDSVVTSPRMKLLLGISETFGNTLRKVKPFINAIIEKTDIELFESLGRDLYASDIEALLERDEQQGSCVVNTALEAYLTHVGESPDQTTVEVSPQLSKCTRREILSRIRLTSNASPPKKPRIP
jgi:hypothetical protein